MDGYIKNKRREIRSVRGLMFYIYILPTIFAVIFILMLMLGLYVKQEPKNWQTTEIVFSSISKEYLGPRYSPDVINSQDEKMYIIDNGLVSSDELKDRLTRGKTYSVTYSIHPITNRRFLEALSDKNTVFLALEESIADHEAYQKNIYIAIFVIIGLEIIALILIDRLVCRKYHEEIRQVKKKIAQRQERMSNRGQ